LRFSKKPSPSRVNNHTEPNNENKITKQQ